MSNSSSLRRRLIAGSVLLAIVIGGVFGSAGYIIVEAIEYELISQRLKRAAEVFVQNHRAGVSVVPSVDLKYAIGDQIPSEMRALPPGLHEVDLGDRQLDVLIVEQGGTRYAVIDDISDFERLEAIAFASLAIAFACGVLLALAIARSSANRIVAPLTRLARAVEHDDAAAQAELVGMRDEIGLLAGAFRTRNSQLAETLRRERLFTADVSHELRTPLTVVMGAAELLSARLENQSELREIAERIRRTSVELSARVGALLHLARAPQADEVGTLDLRDLVLQEIERWRPLLDGKPVDVALDAPDEVWVKADADLVVIAVANLLRNAFHFTQRGTVRVALGRDALVVEDTGPGVPGALRERLFEPFVHGNGPASGNAGAGLGLSIVKRVADRLGWRVGMEDVQQGGSRFSLFFGAV